MERHRQISIAFLALLAMSMAARAGAAAAQSSALRAPVQPRVVSEPVRHDTDDPAIWVDPADPARTLIVGTDKDVDGALYVFGLDCRIKQNTGSPSRGSIWKRLYQVCECPMRCAAVLLFSCLSQS